VEEVVVGLSLEVVVGLSLEAVVVLVLNLILARKTTRNWPVVRWDCPKLGAVQ